MSGYTKLFDRILDSTIWREDNATRILWIAMLALADRNGVVCCTIPGLADRARISLKECEKGLERFQQSDKYSWSQEQDGKRIEVVEGGWRLINYGKYRDMLSREKQKEQNRIRQAAYRVSAGYVYYATCGDRVKIGFSANPWSRLHEMRTANPEMQLSAMERGSLQVEKERHAQFKSAHLTGEWFTLVPELRDWIASLGEVRSERSNHRSIRSNSTTDVSQQAEAEADTDTKAREGASPRYMQSDFDERDMRKFLQARTAITAKLSTGWGQNLTDEELFVEQCMIAEVPPKTMREVLARNGETA